MQTLAYQQTAAAARKLTNIHRRMQQREPGKTWQAILDALTAQARTIDAEPTFFVPDERGAARFWLKAADDDQIRAAVGVLAGVNRRRARRA